ncbi:hypothetical protein C1H46_009070 [Malus baccata]|uniref:C3H1-type domain-containing protein n=1 Tax=Malus baccata TaxID=106549 RepID=A0A540N2N1_MALBA|nr:hypothetical protein C1H46_009070 [Malus baccata]
MMVVSDLDDVFVPLTDDLLVNLSESRSVVESMFQDNVNVESAFGRALKASLMLMEYQPWGKIVNISGTRRGVRRCLLSDNQLLREAMTGGCSIRAIWILNSLDAVVFSRSSPNTFSRYPLSISIMGCFSLPGLAEQMWQLGLTSSELCPERPGVPNCVYYMRTEFCGYGGRCQYNHHRDRGAVVAAVRATGDYPGRVGGTCMSGMQ